MKCNGRLQRSARVEEGEPKRRSTMEEARGKIPTSYSVNTSAASLISTSSVVEEVEEGRRRGEQSLDLRSQYTTSPKSGWI